MLKRFLLAVILIVVSSSLGFAAESLTDIEVRINGESVKLEDPLILKAGRILAPARFMFDQLGIDMQWDTENEVASALIGDLTIDIPLESREVTVYGETETLDIPAQVFHGKTYLPVRFIVESLGTHVHWSETLRTIDIVTPDIFDPPELKDIQQPILHVAYPPRSPHSLYGSPVYVFGTTNSYAHVAVTVNGRAVEKHDPRTGNFLTMVEVPRGEEYLLEITATDRQGLTTTIERLVNYPDPPKVMPEDPLDIHTAHLVPSQNQALGAGDTLQVIVRGSPGAEASFTIGDDGSRIEMPVVENPPWPFAQGEIYAGTYTVREEDGVNEEPAPKPIVVTLRRDEEEVRRELPGKVSFLPRTPYKIIEVKEQEELEGTAWLWAVGDHTFILHTPTRCGTGNPTSIIGYLAEGTRYEVAGISGDYYRVKLTDEKTVLIHQDAVTEVQNVNAVRSTLSKLTLRENEERISIRFDTSERIPFLVQESADRLELDFYGVRHGEAPPVSGHAGFIRNLEVKANAGGHAGTMKITVELEKEMWGYLPSWDGNKLVLDIHKPPLIDAKRPLTGKTILVDPGHGGLDSGAIGPGHLHEKDVVLEMSLLLACMLQSEGANVLLTREEDEALDLFRRTDFLMEKEVDLFISVHANAHPHGADAVATRGVMTLYNHNHHEKLAQIMLDAMAEGMGMPAVRAWKTVLAVTRHTHVPSVLVEAGYMMHPEDSWYILHPAGQEKFAAAITKGIREYFLSFSD